MAKPWLDARLPLLVIAVGFSNGPRKARRADPRPKARPLGRLAPRPRLGRVTRAATAATCTAGVGKRIGEGTRERAPASPAAAGGRALVAAGAFAGAAAGATAPACIGNRGRADVLET